MIAVPRFYSPEWVTAFNEAVADLAPPAGAGLAAPAPSAEGEGAGTMGGRARFRVAQVVTGGPEGDLRVVLDVAGDRMRIERHDVGPEPEPEPDVTVVLGYEDAAALSRGELDPAAMVGTGRLKVRGNLSLLLAGQALLAAAADRLAPLAASTTY